MLTAQVEKAENGKGAQAHAELPSIYGNTEVLSSGDPLSPTAPEQRNGKISSDKERTRLQPFLGAFGFFWLIDLSFFLLQLCFRDSVKICSALTKLCSFEVCYIFLFF